MLYLSACNGKWKDNFQFLLYLIGSFLLSIPLLQSSPATSWTVFCCGSHLLVGCMSMDTIRWLRFYQWPWFISLVESSGTGLSVWLKSNLPTPPPRNHQSNMELVEGLIFIRLLYCPLLFALFLFAIKHCYVFNHLSFSQETNLCFYYSYKNIDFNDVWIYSSK